MADVKLRLLIQAVNSAGRSLSEAQRQIDQLGQSSRKAGAAGRKAGEDGKKGFEDFGAGADKAAEEVQQLESAVGDLAGAGAALVAVGAALAATVIFPIQRAAQFERAMAGVKAVTTGAEESFAALSAAAAELGRTTKFTATEAAEGMVFLGQAGFDAGEVIKAIGPSLRLAAAGGLDLATAADIASNVVSAMRLEVEDLNHVVDVLANTAANSNTNVSQLAQALKFAAPIAASAGISIEETAAAIGVLGDNGIQASMAGTTMRGMLISLAAPAKKAQDALDKLGVEIAKNEDGSINLVKTMRALRDANFDLADASAIFRRSAASGALAMANQIDKVESLTIANEIAIGAAEKMAKTMEENLIGAITLLSSAFDGLLRAIGAPLLDGLTAVVEKITSMVSFMAELADEFPTVATAIAGLVAALAALFTGFGAILLTSAAILKFILLVKAGITALSTVFALLRVKILAARAASLAFLATPVGIAIVALAAVLTAGVIAWDKWRFGSEKAAQQAKKTGATIDEQQDKLERYATALEGLEEGTREYSIIASEIAEIIPGVSLTLDENGQIVAEVSEKYEDLEDATRAWIEALEVKRLQALNDELFNNVKALEKERFWIDLNQKALDLLAPRINKAGDRYSLLTGHLDKNGKILRSHNEKIAESADKQAALTKAIDEVINKMVKEGKTAQDVAKLLEEAGASAEIKKEALASYEKFRSELQKTGKTSVDVRKELEKIKEEGLEAGKALQKLGKASEKAFNTALAKAEKYAKKVRDINNEIRDLERGTTETIRDLKREQLDTAAATADREAEIAELKNKIIRDAEEGRFDEAKIAFDRAKALEKEAFEARRKLAEDEATVRTEDARKAAEEQAKALTETLGEEIEAADIPAFKPEVDVEGYATKLKELDAVFTENVLEPQLEAAQEAEDGFRESAENIREIYNELKVELQDIDIKVTAEGFEELLDRLQAAAGEDIEIVAKTTFTGEASPERPLEETIQSITNEYDTMASLFSEPLTVNVDAHQAIVAIDEVAAGLASLQDKTVTVTVQKVEQSSAGGVVGEALQNVALRLSRGMKLPGYGGGDRVHAMLEPGERVTNKRSVSILDSVMPGLMDAMNRVKSNLDVNRLMERLTFGFSHGGLVSQLSPPPVMLQGGGTIVQKPDLADFGQVEIKIGAEAFPVMAPDDVIQNLKSAIGREKLIRSN